MSSLEFGSILIGLGVVAYGVNRLLKPAGWLAGNPEPQTQE
jgi:hypothetical protein